MAILLEIKNDNSHLLVYRIDFEDEYYYKGIDFTDFDREEYSRLTNPLKRKQWLASRYWVKKLSKQQRTLYLQKSELGKPHITNYPFYFSISHSKDIVAIICSERQEVAVDIEHIQDKIRTIKKKFLHPNDFEQLDNLNSLSIIWSAKETIYKYYHNKALYSFKEQIAITSCHRDVLTYQLSNYPDTVSNSVCFREIGGFIVTWIG